MAVSLVSTGVQFPDSTIQTTAAGASAMNLISTTTASGASTVDLALTGGYTNYTIMGAQVRGNGFGGSIGIAYTTNNFSSVSTWQSVLANGYTPGGPSGTYFTNNNDVTWIFGQSLSVPYANSTMGASFTVTIYNPASSTLNKQMFGQMGGRAALDFYNCGVSVQGVAYNFADSLIAPINGLRIYLGNSKVVSGLFKLYGIS